MAVAQPQHVADHRHDRERAREVGAPLEPRLGRGRFHPEHAVQVHAARVRERVLEHLDLLKQREVVEVRGEVEHEPVLHVQQDGARHAVVAHERVQRVALRHPLDEPRVSRERHDRVAMDAKVEPRAVLGRAKQRVDEAEELHHALVLAQVLMPLEQEAVLDAVGAEDGEPARPLLRVHHLDRGRESLDGDDLARGVVRAGHRELEVVRTQQLGRHLLELERARLLQLSPELSEHGVEALPRRL